MITRRLVITGRVQGVGYRAWFAKQAQEAKLAGWVRNRRDGSVEALIHGPEDAVSRLIAKSYEGPGFAQVEAVTIGETETAQTIENAVSFEVAADA